MLIGAREKSINANSNNWRSKYNPVHYILLFEEMFGGNIKVIYNIIFYLNCIEKGT